MQVRVRPAPPSVLFRKGGKTIADHMAGVKVPSWVPERFEAEYTLSVIIEDEFRAAARVRSLIHAKAMEQKHGRTWPAKGLEE